MSLPKHAKKVFEGVMFDVYQWEQEQFDSSTKTFEAVKRKESVQLIATQEDKLLLLEEEQPHTGKFIALIGGICDTQNPIDDAKRELLEETGMICKDIQFWQQTGFSAKIIWNTNYYIARNCTKITNPQLDAGERINVFKVTFEEFIEKVLTDDFRNREFSNMILKMIHEDKLDEFKKMIFNK